MQIKLLALIALMEVVILSKGDKDSCEGRLTGENNCFENFGKYVYQDGYNAACLPIIAFKNEKGDREVPCMDQKHFDTEEDCKKMCLKDTKPISTDQINAFENAPWMTDFIPQSHQ